jgi:hypothetical protein
MKHFEEWRVIVTFNIALPIEPQAPSMSGFLYEGIKKGLQDVYLHKHEKMGTYSNPCVIIQEIKD